MNKQQRYLKISRDIVECVGGKENIQGVAHCATRLRIVLDDDTKLNKEKLEEIELAKGAFMAGDQLQIIFGAGLVNEVYDVFSKLEWKICLYQMLRRNQQKSKIPFKKQLNQSLTSLSSSCQLF